MKKKAPYKFNTIGEYHIFRGLPEPEHPLISLINFDKIQLKEEEPERFVFSFYSIALRRHSGGKFNYGQQEYYHNDGVMFFMAPEQVFGIDFGTEENPSGWLLMVHPDFFLHTHLTNLIKQYDFFDYTTNEALYLSKKEEECMIRLFEIIHREYYTNIDNFSRPIIIAQLELVLAYSQRYYNRQFITQRVNKHGIVSKLETLLKGHFAKESSHDKSIPTVREVADQLNVSPKYLSGLLRNITGQSTQQHIQNRLIESAKEKLSTTDLSISEIAYELGFEHPQSFSKLFKIKTEMTPLAFRQSFG